MKHPVLTKFLVLLTALMIAVTHDVALAQSSGPVYTTDAAGQVNQVVDHLAQKLSVPVTKLYTVLVKQSYVEGLMDLATAGVFGVFIFFAAVTTLRVRHRYFVGVKAASVARNGDHYMPDLDKIYLGVSSAIIFIGTIFFVGYLRPALGEIVNPEYYAIRTIVDAINPPAATR